MPMKQILNQQQLDSLSPVERDFLRQAEKKYRANTFWLDFEDWAFSMRSPVFSRNRTHRNIVQNPLFIALKEMWLDLGVKQGGMAPSKGENANRARRQTRGSGASGNGRNLSTKRDVANSDSRPQRRVSKSRT